MLFLSYLHYNLLMKTQIKQEDYKYFLIIVISAFLSISIVFGYAYSYIKDDKDFTTHKLRGIAKIEQVQYIIFNLQNLRGLSSIVQKDQECHDEISKMHKLLKTRINTLKDIVNSNKKEDHLQDEFITYLNKVNIHTKHTTSFIQLTKTIKEGIILIEKVAYHANITLDSEIKSFILTQTIILTLPKLIEFNGRIRGISSSLENNMISTKQRNDIIILKAKVKDQVTQLEFNLNQLAKTKSTSVNIALSDTINAQNTILDFINNNILIPEHTPLKSNDIFNFLSTNIDFIKILYKDNLTQLTTILNIRLDNKNFILKAIIIIGISFSLFIGLINYIFFTKNRKFIEEIKLLSITDGMTNLYNRRHFDNEFLRQLKAAKRIEHSLIFIIMDIDHFKQYNDIYGHLEGDNALIMVADSLKENLNRPTDMVFRLGGEEFGVLCSNMSEKHALIFANKLKNNIKDLNIVHKGNSASKYLTISMGLVTIMPQYNHNVDDLYKYADTALYNAKEQGRNNVLAYDFSNKI